MTCLKTKEDLRLSNTAPSAHAKDLIFSEIKDIDLRISSDDEAIAILESKLVQVKAKRATDIVHRQSLAALVSPLRTMPLEILGKIFVYASAVSLSSRVHVSHVSQLWRCAALAASELWSTIHVQWTKMSEEDLEYYIRSCVRRARSRPLTLLLQESYLVEYDEMDVILKATSGCRWKDVSWTSWNARFYQTFFGPRLVQLAQNSYDTLESLTLNSFSDFFDETEPEFIFLEDIEQRFIPLDLKLISKRLTKLSISLFFSIIFLEAPWSQLTHLSLKAPNSVLHVIVSILRECHNLEALNLDLQQGEMGEEDPPEGYAQCALLKLQKLHFHGGSDSAFCARIINLLITPVLRELIIDVDVISLGLDHSIIGAYIKASAPTLRRLWISGEFTHVHDLIGRLYLLEELAIVAGGSSQESEDTDMFEPLEYIFTSQNDESAVEGNTLCTISSTDEMQTYIFFPRLRALKVICKVFPELQDAFMNAVKSRWWQDAENTNSQRPISRLRNASLQQQVSCDKLVVANQVERLRSEGLQINVLKGTPDEFIPGFTGDDDGME